MRELASLAGIESMLMQRLYWENRPAYDQGLVGGRDYFRNMLAGAGVFPDPSVIDQMVECDVQSWSRINPETERLMNDVKKAGLKLGMLSNMIQPFLDRARTDIPVFGLPDGAVFSCEVNTIKPEKKIYELLLGALGCGAEELVFFDDARVNVAAAAELGIHAFFWNGPADARRELELLCAGRL